MRIYETTIVIDSFLKNEEIENLVNKTKTFIENNGGEIIKITDRGKKRLAYEIKRRQYGNYYHIVYSAPPTLPKLLEREFKLEEAILRYLTVILDKKALKAMELQEQPAKAGVMSEKEEFEEEPPYDFEEESEDEDFELHDENK